MIFAMGAHGHLCAPEFGALIMPTPAEQLGELLQRAKDRRCPVVLLGVGSPLRGDDAIGHVLAGTLADLNDAYFHTFAVGTAIENATHLVSQCAGGILLIVDALLDESLPEGSWAFFPADRLDTYCHTTHSIPLSLLISLWQHEFPGIDIHFLGISIRNNTDLSPLSPLLQGTLHELHSLITGCFA